MLHLPRPGVEGEEPLGAIAIKQGALRHDVVIVLAVVSHSPANSPRDTSLPEVVVRTVGRYRTAVAGTRVAALTIAAITVSSVSMSIGSGTGYPSFMASNHGLP